MSEKIQKLKSLISQHNLYLIDGVDLDKTQVLRIKLSIKDYEKQLKNLK